MSNPESSQAESRPSANQDRATQSYARRAGKTVGALLLTGLAATGCASVYEGSPAPTASSSASATAETSASPRTTTATNAPSTPQAPVITGKTYTEVSQYGANVFSDYKNGSGVTGHVAVGESVSAVCIEFDPTVAIPSTAGLWYEIAADSQFTSGGYVPANTFWNQDPPQPPDQNNQYDKQVPVCANSPSQQLPPVHGSHGN